MGIVAAGRPFCAFVHDCRDMAKPRPWLHSVKGTSLFQGAVPITERGGVNALSEGGI